VRARPAAGSPNGDDLLDLVKPEAQPPRSLDEREEDQGVDVADAVPGRGAPGCGHNPVRLVEAESLAAHAAPGGDLADQQTVSSHTPRLNLRPRVNVKTNAAGDQRAGAKLLMLSHWKPGRKVSNSTMAIPTGARSDPGGSAASVRRGLALRLPDLDVHGEAIDLWPLLVRMPPPEHLDHADDHEQGRQK